MTSKLPALPTGTEAEGSIPVAGDPIRGNGRRKNIKGAQPTGCTPFLHRRLEMGVMAGVNPREMGHNVSSEKTISLDIFNFYSPNRYVCDCLAV